jgi:high affinity sulfate transporter 1
MAVSRESTIDSRRTLSGLVPIAGWLRTYPKEWWRPDVIAGLTAAAVVIPKAMAYATIAGLPLEVGLYTVFTPMVIYAVLGTSRALSVSTSATLAVLAAAQLGVVVPPGDRAQLMAASTTLTMLVGGILLLAAILRFGFVANFISEPVLTGFKSGIGLVIVADQLPKLLGIHVEKGSFFHNVVAIVTHVGQASVPTLVLGVLLLVLIFGLEYLAPRAPTPLIAVGVAIAASVLLGLKDLGVETVGSIPSGLPAFAWPNLDLVSLLWPGAVGIALMSFTESIAAARAFGATGEPRAVPNQELLALGAANIGGGLFGAMPAGGGTTQTAVNRLAGARSQMAELVTAGTALAAMLFLAPLIAPLPHAALAAVVIAYSVGLISPAEFRKISRVRRIEFGWALVAFVGVVALGTLQGIVAAVVVSLLSLLQQTSNPPVYAVGRKQGTDVFRPLSDEHPHDETLPGLLMVRIEGRLYFGNAERVAEKLRPLIEDAKPAVVVLDCSAVTDIEYTALKMLTEAEEQARQDGITLWLVAINPEVRHVIEHSPLGQVLGRERMLFNLESAIEKHAGSERRFNPAKL